MNFSTDHTGKRRKTGRGRQLLSPLLKMKKKHAERMRHWGDLWAAVAAMPVSNLRWPGVQRDPGAWENTLSYQKRPPGQLTGFYLHFSRGPGAHTAPPLVPLLHR